MTFIVENEIDDGVVGKERDAVLLRLLVQDRLLLAPVIVQEGPGTGGKSVALEFIEPFGLHGDAPAVPEMDHGCGFFKKAAGKDGVVACAGLAVQDLPGDDAHIVAMDFREIASKVVASCGTRAAPARMAFIHNNDSCAFFGCGYGCLQCCDATTHTYHIIFTFICYGNHKLNPLMRSSDFTCNKRYGIGMRKVMAPLGQSILHAVQCQHSSGYII